MNLKTAINLRILRVVPGTCGKLHHMWYHTVSQFGAGQTATPAVEHANDIPILDIAGGGIVRVQANNLPALCLGITTVASEIKLAVQFFLRLIRQQVQGIGLRQFRIQPLVLIQPGRVSRTVRIVETVNIRGKYFDFSRRGRQWMPYGICPELFDIPDLVR